MLTMLSKVAQTVLLRDGDDVNTTNRQLSLFSTR